MALTLDSNNGVTVPSWTTAGRPASPSTGEFGFNSTTSKLEVYNGTSWVNMG